MKRYVIRHASTGVTRDLRSSYGADGPPLSEVGVAEAKKLGDELSKLGIDFKEPVAVSDYLRTKQTAHYAGFTDIQVRPVLGEIYTGLPNPELKTMLLQGQLPPIVLEKVRAILDNPPKEKVWVTHGLVIMGLRELLGTATDEFLPANAKAYEFDI